MQRYDPVTAYPTLRAKAVALYEKTYRLTSCGLLLFDPLMARS